MPRSATKVKKAYNLPPDLVRRVKKVLRAKTETEAIVRSLQQIAFMDDVERAVQETEAAFPKLNPFVPSNAGQRRVSAGQRREVF